MTQKSVLVLGLAAVLLISPGVSLAAGGDPVPYGSGWVLQDSGGMRDATNWDTTDYYAYMSQGDTPPQTFSDPSPAPAPAPSDNSPGYVGGNFNAGNTAPPPSQSSGPPPMQSGDIALTADWAAFERDNDHYPKQDEVHTLILVARNSNPFPGLVRITADFTADPNQNPDHNLVDVHREWTITMDAAKDGQPSEVRIPVQYRVHRYENKYWYNYLMAAHIEPLPPPPKSEDLRLLNDSDPNNDGFRFKNVIPAVHLVQ